MRLELSRLQPGFRTDPTTLQSEKAEKDHYKKTLQDN